MCGAGSRYSSVRGEGMYGTIDLFFDQILIESGMIQSILT
jgi:hypothetical protein